LQLGSVSAQLLTNQLAIWLRRSLRRRRRLRVVILKLVGARTRAYEQRFGIALLAAVRPGDCVWDGGANVGFYTSRLLERVGPNGRVVAIEPSPECLDVLCEAGDDARRIVVAAALSNTDGEAYLRLSGERGTTSSLSESRSGAVPVRTVRGETLVRDGIPAPDVAKVDVEGFESEVIEGLGDLLGGIRSILVEVHFGALDKRGKSNEPTAIVRKLQSQGFSVCWLDPSHLAAVKRS